MCSVCGGWRAVASRLGQMPHRRGRCVFRCWAEGLHTPAGVAQSPTAIAMAVATCRSQLGSWTGHETEGDVCATTRALTANSEVLTAIVGPVWQRGRGQSAGRCGRGGRGRQGGRGVGDKKDCRGSRRVARIQGHASTGASGTPCKQCGGTSWEVCRR